MAKTTHKIEKNFQFEFVALAIAVRKDYTFSTMPLNLRSDWYSLKGLNGDRLKTKNKKLYRFLKANRTKKQREELFRKVTVLFD